MSGRALVQITSFLSRCTQMPEMVRVPDFMNSNPEVRQSFGEAVM